MHHRVERKPNKDQPSTLSPRRQVPGKPGTHKIIQASDTRILSVTHFGVGTTLTEHESLDHLWTLSSASR